jgi:N-acetyl-gamma-glutamyl-phosphate reductase
VRGIFTTLFLPQVGIEELEEIFRGSYDGEALISVVRGSPEIRWIQGTPRSVIGLEGDSKRSVVFSVTDNLGKGAAGQAIQNLNLALGLPETEGLLFPGGFV